MGKQRKPLDIKSMAEQQSTQRQDKFASYLNTEQSESQIFTEGLKSKFDYGVGADADLGEIRAERQGFGDKLANGMVKMTGTAVTSAVEPAAMLLGGMYDFMQTGEVNLTNNEGTRLMDSLNEQLSESMPHYYSKEELEGDLADKVFSANFLTDKLTNGLGFMLGAVASGYGMNKALDGFRFSSKLRGLMKGNKALNPADDLVRNGEVVGELANFINASKASATAQNMVVGSIASMGESSIESRHLENEMLEKFAKDPKFKDMPFEEQQKLASDMAKINFWVNMAVVGYSNYVQFPSIFGRGYANEASNKLASQVSKRLIEDNGQLVVAGTARQGLRGLGRAAGGAVPEAFEEYAQGVSSRALTDYALKKYDSEKSNSEGAMDIIKSYASESVRSIGDTDAQEEMLLGFIIGLIGSGRRNYAEVAQEDAGLAQIAEAYNNETDTFTKKLKPIVEDIIRSESYADHRTRFLNNGDRFNYNSAEFAQFYSYVDSRIEAGRYQEVEDMISELENSDPDTAKERYGIERSSDELKSVAETLRDRAKNIYETKNIVDNAFAYVSAPNDYAEDLQEIKQQMAYYAAMANENDRKGKELQQAVIDDAGSSGISLPVTSLNSNMRKALQLQNEIDVSTNAVNNYMNEYIDNLNITSEEKQELTQMPYNEKLKYLEDFSSEESQMRLRQLNENIANFQKQKATILNSPESIVATKNAAQMKIKETEKQLSDIDSKIDNAATVEEETALLNEKAVITAEQVAAKTELEAVENTYGLQEATLVSNWQDVISNPPVTMDKMSQKELSEIQKQLKVYDEMIKNRTELLESRRNQRVSEAENRRLDIEARRATADASQLDALNLEAQTVEDILSSIGESFDATADTKIAELRKARDPYQKLLDANSEVENYWSTLEALNASISNNSRLGEKADRLLKNSEELLKNREARNQYLSAYNNLFTDFRAQDTVPAGLKKWRDNKDRMLAQLQEEAGQNIALQNERDVINEKVSELQAIHPDDNLSNEEKLYTFNGPRGKRNGRIIQQGEDFFFKSNEGFVASIVNSVKDTRANLKETYGENIIIEGETFKTADLYSYNISNIETLSQEDYIGIQQEREARKQMKALNRIYKDYRAKIVNLQQYMQEAQSQYEAIQPMHNLFNSVFEDFVNNRITSKTKTITNPITGEKVRLNMSNPDLVTQKITEVFNDVQAYLENYSKELQRTEGAIRELEKTVDVINHIRSLNALNKEQVTVEDLEITTSAISYPATPNGYQQQLRDHINILKESEQDPALVAILEAELADFKELSITEQQEFAEALQDVNSSSLDTYRFVQKLQNELNTAIKNIETAFKEEGVVTDDEVILWGLGEENRIDALQEKAKNIKYETLNEISKTISQVPDADVAKLFELIDQEIQNQEASEEAKRNQNDNFEEQTSENQYSSPFDYEVESTARISTKTAGKHEGGSQTDKEFYDWTAKNSVDPGKYHLKTYNYSQRGELDGLDFQSGFEDAIIAVVVDSSGKVQKGPSGKPLQAKLHDPELLGQVENGHIVPAEGKQYAHISFKHHLAHDSEMNNKVQEIMDDDTISEENKEKQIDAVAQEFLDIQKSQLQNIIDSAREGSIELAIENQSNGIPEIDPISPGFRFADLNPVYQAFGKNPEIEIVIPESDYHMFPDGQFKDVKPGVPYAYDHTSGKYIRVFTPNLFEARATRKLKSGSKNYTNSPATTLMKLLMVNSLMPKGNQFLNYTDPNTSKSYSIPVYNNKKMKRGAITDLIYYGSEREGLPIARQFYVSGNNLIFGEEGSIPLSEIVSMRPETRNGKTVQRMYVDLQSHPELESFLQSKLMQVNRGRLGFEATAEDTDKMYMDVEDVWFPMDDNGNVNYSKPEAIAIPYASYSDKLLGYEGKFEKGGTVVRKPFKDNQGLPMIRTNVKPNTTFKQSYLSFSPAGQSALVTESQPQEAKNVESLTTTTTEEVNSLFETPTQQTEAQPSKTFEGKVEGDLASGFLSEFGVAPESKTETPPSPATAVEETTETPPAQEEAKPAKRFEGKVEGDLASGFLSGFMNGGDNVAFSTPNPNINIESYGVYNPAQMQSDLKWFRKNFPGHDISVVGGLINGKHFGAALDTGDVLISDQAADGTVFHEAFHVGARMYAGEKQMAEIRDEFRNQEGKSETYRGEVKEYKDFTPLEVEEALAEEFRHYAITRTRPLSVTDRIFKFFEDMYRFFENLLKGRNQTKVLFDSILSGEVSKADRSNADSTAYSEGRTFNNISLIQEYRMVDGMVTYITNNLMDGLSAEDILSGTMNIRGEVRKAAMQVANDMAKYVPKATLVEFATDITQGSYFSQKVAEKLQALGLTGEFESVLEEGISTQENERYKDTTFMREANTIDPKKMVSKVSKLFLRAQPQFQDGKIKRDEFGLPIPSDFNSNWLKVTNKMVGVQPNMGSFKQRLQELADTTKDQAIANYVEAITKFEGDKNGELLLTRILQDFAKNKNTYNRFLISENGDISHVSADTNKKVREITEGWRLSYTDKVGAKPSKQLINKMRTLFRKRKYTEMLSEMGIEFDNPSAAITGSYKMKSGKTSTIKELSKSVLDTMTKASQSNITNYDPFVRTTYEGDNLNLGVAINGLASIESSFTNKPLTNQIDNEDGQVVYTIGLNTYLSRVASMINDGKTSEEISAMFPHWDSLSEKHFYWKRLSNNNPITVEIISGMDSTDSEVRGKTTRKFSPDELFINYLAAINEGISPVMTTADRGVKHGFNIGKQNVLRRKIHGPKIQEIFEGYVAYDKSMLSDAKRAGVKFANFQQKRVFEGWTENNIPQKLEQYLNSERTKLLNKLVADRVIRPEDANNPDSIEPRNSKIPNNLFEDYREGNKANLTELLNDFIINSVVSNFEQQMFFGDVRAFKSPLDTYKRLSMFNSTKKISRTDTAWMDEHYPRKDGKSGEDRKTMKTIVYKDVTRSSDYIDEYKQAFVDNFIADGMNPKQAKTLSEIYSSVYENYDEADAAGWVTVDEYRDILLRSGDWTLKQEKAYDKISNGENLSPEDYVAFPPLKTQYVGPSVEAVDAGLNINSGYKHSLSPLIPSAVKGTALDNLRQHMEDNQIGIAQLESGVKFGVVLNNGKINPLEKSGGEFNTNTNTQDIYYDFFGIQQDMAPKQKTQTTVSTQAQKAVMSDAFSMGELQVPEGMESSAEKLRDDIKGYEDALQGLIGRQRAILLDTLFPRVKNNFSQADFSKYLDNVVTRLLDLANSRDMADNIKNDIMNLRRHASLEVLMNSSEVESILHSFMNNSIISRKTNGSQMVQVPSTGYVRNDIKGDKGLKFYRTAEDGTTLPMQIKVALPQEYMNYVESVGGLSEFNKNIPDSVKFGTALRIPVQAMNSLDAYEVVEFLPPENGDMIIVPSEIVAKSGSDFDIDKLVVYRSNTVVTPQGIKKPSASLDAEAQYKAYYKEAIKNDALNATRNAIISENMAKAQEIRDYKQLEEAFKNAKDDDARKALSKAMMDVSNDGFISEITALDLAVELSVEDARLQNQMISEGKLYSPEEFTNLPKAMQIDSGSLENFINDKMFSILTNPINKRLLLSPIDDTYLKKNVRKMAESVENKHTIKSFASAQAGAGLLDIFSPISNMEKHNDYLAGKDSVALVANNIAMRPLMQRGNITMPAPESSVWPFPHNTDSNGKMSISGKTDMAGFRISETLSALMNGAVDIAKDPYIFAMNAGIHNLNNVMALVHAGVPLDWTFKFMNNPIIKDYIHLKGLMRSNFNNVNAVTNKRIEKILGDKYGITPGIMSSVKNQKITDGIINGQTPLDYANMLNAMADIEFLSDQVNQIILAVKMDTKGVDKSKDSLDLRVSRYNNLLAETAFSNVSSIVEDTFMRSYHLATLDFQQRSGRFYPLKNNPMYRQFRENIGAVKMDFALREKLMRAVQNEMLAYSLLSQDSNAKLKDMFYGNNSLADRVLKLQARAKKGEIQVPSVIMELNPNIDHQNKIRGLRLFSKKMDNTQINQHVAELNEYDEMLSEELGMKDFGVTFKKALGMMDLIQTGKNYSPISMRSIIPVETYDSLINEFVKKGRSVDFAEFMKKFTSQSANLQYLPRLRELPKDGIINMTEHMKVMGAAGFFNPDTKAMDLYRLTRISEEQAKIEKEDILGIGQSIRSYHPEFDIIPGKVDTVIADKLDSNDPNSEVDSTENTSPGVIGRQFTIGGKTYREGDLATGFLDSMTSVESGTKNDNLQRPTESVSQKQSEDRQKQCK